MTSDGPTAPAPSASRGTPVPAGAGRTTADSPSTLPATAGETSPDSPWPLHLLSEKLKAHIERAPAAWVEGQVIELNRRASMCYITLRDVDSEVSLSLSVYGTVMDRTSSPLERGSRVVARLKPDFWLKTGRLSMQTIDIRPVGIGDLLARIERLRQALAGEGLFSDARKKPLPLLPHRIGLITGRDSDAMKDVMRNAALRWPAVEFEVREVAVQGVSSVAQVTAALAELDAHEQVDVIIIARGGGALEDLLPFSDESLVRAVAGTATPVVSAIGHEADRPLLDDVADLRASTPTDAAKRVVPDVGEELARIRQARAALERSIRVLVHRESDSLANLRSRPSLSKPEGMIDVREADIERLRSRALRCVTAAVDREADAVLHLRQRVRSLSPQKTLDRGYAVVQTIGGQVIRDPADVGSHEPLHVRVAGGQFAVRAEETLAVPERE
ncbi:exodeoxyribonuclease VII large subunit [Arthrobacter agilis]|uniref:exodeoxyribonuclease VII large subunit n=1 Tax=Arthrobacter agilis TaxID=37921 RepID=UPI000B363A61|nr:exodeoxyribonuclease VII large subunit [Arthrobacter agilis]OUM41422.1 exodeoxyribonuclease VII large subunit [Arthrobacter agilis]PPB46247.1 exodeoxyribonuclease VII large subunit [Arthrobacter agilis]TPV27001.1 exodeoxyribonuclease VII large subunit [Arthrobacter agilis]VDR32857.1 Exodeoxyribonuclease 7 large subunit [Arthrobacter agilis]